MTRSSLLFALLLFLLGTASLASAALDHDHDHEHDLPLLDIETEDPVEHLVHVTDSDGDSIVDTFELSNLFQSLQNKVLGAAAAASAANDPHAGHAHAKKDAEITAFSAPTHVLSVEQVFDRYAEGLSYMSETQFIASFPALLMCAAESTCEFEHTKPAETTEGEDSTKHLGMKLGLLVGIFFLALIGGVAPLGIRNFVQVDGVLALVNCFSGGVFMCTGLTHILPHVVEYGAGVSGYGDYPLPYALVMLGYMLVFLVERVVFHIHKHGEDDEEAHAHGHCGVGVSEKHSASRGSEEILGHGHGHGHGHDDSASRLDGDFDSVDEKTRARGETPSSAVVPLYKGNASRIKEKYTNAALYTSLSVLVAISLHAVLAGVSLGMQSERSRVAAVAVAICSHKAPAAFSVGSKFIRSGLPPRHVMALVIVFTLVTPFGIVIGIWSGGASPIAKLVLEGLGAGTFIYIGATEISADEFETTARACDKLHGVGRKTEKDAEAAVHTHRTHEAPSRPARLLAFSAYVAGVFIIFMSNLASHAD